MYPRFRARWRGPRSGWTLCCLATRGGVVRTPRWSKRERGRWPWAASTSGWWPWARARATTETSTSGCGPGKPSRRRWPPNGRRPRCASIEQAERRCRRTSLSALDADASVERDAAPRWIDAASTRQSCGVAAVASSSSSTTGHRGTPGPGRRRPVASLIGYSESAGYYESYPSLRNGSGRDIFVNRERVGSERECPSILLHGSDDDHCTLRADVEATSCREMPPAKKQQCGQRPDKSALNF